MKKFTLLFALIVSISVAKAQLGVGPGLEGVYVEKYYLTNAADSTNAADNTSITNLKIGSTTYRVFIDMAPGYKFNSMFGSTVTSGTNVIVHPLIFKTTTNFYNDPNYGQIFPQNLSVVNTRRNTALIDSWLSVGGVCVGRMGIPKTEDPDGSIGNSNGVLTNNPGGIYGAPINSVNANAKDGLMPGSPLSPQVLGISSATLDPFDQGTGNTFSVTNGAIAALGGVVGTTSTNMVLIGQFTTKGVFTFSLNVQLQNTLTLAAENYVTNNAFGSEYNFAGLGYTSGSVVTPTVPSGDTTGIGVKYTDASNILIYPNPSKGLFTINVTNVKANANNFFSLYDLTGRLVFTRPMRSSSTEVLENVDICDLVDGLYFLEVSIDGVSSTKKLVKQ